MKFLYKKRRFITSVLVVTVSLMLFLFSLPASASSTSGALYIDRFSVTGVKNPISVGGASFTVNVSHLQNNELNIYAYPSGNSFFTIHKGDNFSLSINFLIHYTLVQHIGGAINVGISDANTNGVFSLKLDSFRESNETDYMLCSCVVPSSTFSNMMDYLRVSSFSLEFINFRVSGNLMPQLGDFYITLVNAMVSDIGYIGGGGNFNPGSGTGRSFGDDEASNFSNLAEILTDAINSIPTRIVSYFDNQYASTEGNFDRFFNPNSPEFFLNTNAFEFVGDRIAEKLQNAGLSVSFVWDGLKPILTAVLDYGVIPAIDGILTAVNSIVTSSVDAFSPLLSDMINYFSPYFNEITTLITDKFIDLWTGLSPILNQFITDISPAFDSIVEGIASNISRIFNECFVPDNSSQEFQEFVGMKDTVENKFPVFVQVKTFLTALFNPSGYTSGSSVQYSNLIRSYDGFTSKNVNFGRSYYFDCVSGKTYTVSIRSSGVCNLNLHNGDGIHIKGISGSGVFSLTYTFNYTGSAKFFISFNGNTDVFTVSDVCLYSVDSSAGQEFTVNVYGKNVSVLNFDWYMPYKHYGDICVIAFCYLAFIWHTFKRLPSMI